MNFFVVWLGGVEARCFVTRAARCTHALHLAAVLPRELHMVGLGACLAGWQRLGAGGVSLAATVEPRAPRLLHLGGGGGGFLGAMSGGWAHPAPRMGSEARFRCGGLGSIKGCRVPGGSPRPPVVGSRGRGRQGGNPRPRVKGQPGAGGHP